MTAMRLVSSVTLLLLLAAPIARAPSALASSSYHATDDPDLVHEATAGELAAAKATLQLNDKPDVTDDQGHTPLMRAAEHGHRDIVKLLLAHNAAVNRTDELGKTPLIWAAEGGDGEIIDTLIQAGAKIEQATREGITPLMAAAHAGQIDAVSHLIAAGAQVDRDDYSGRDALGWARESHNSRVVDMLQKAQKR